MAAIKFSFEPPVHGWLPVRVSSGTSVVEFIASDVPNDPVQELMSALQLSFRQERASVWWHLEPDGYYFDFLPETSGVQLRISFAPYSEQKREEVFAVTGSWQEVLLPIWRALRRLESLKIREPHWPPVDFMPLQQIRELLRVPSAT